VVQEVELLLQQLQIGPQAQQPGAADSAAAAEPVQFPRPRFSPMPQCLPKLSLEQQAQKLLSQGHALRALRRLCDGPPYLLYQYAAAAGNLQLVELLITEQNRTGVLLPHSPWDFPTTGVSTSNGGIQFLNTAQLCAYAAMRKGHAHVLTALLWRSGSSIKGGPAPHQMGQLLRCAVRHSNAACLQTLLEFAFIPHLGLHGTLPWPQHLVMAAGRADPWAGGVVGLLLRVIAPKLLAAKYMRPVYLAACKTGHVPVLQQLVQRAVQHAAAGCAGDVYRLLSAAAEAGNLRVWRALLGLQQDAALSGRSSGSSSGGGVGLFNSNTAGVTSRDPCAQQTTGHEQLPASDGCRLFKAQPRMQQGEVTGTTAAAAALGSIPHQPQQQQQAEGHDPQVLALPMLMVCSALQDPADMLLQILQQMSPTRLRASDVKLQLQADADRAAMADAFVQWLDQVPSGPVLWADTLRNHASGLDSIQAEMRARYSLDAFPWAPGSLGRLQQLLAGPSAPSAAQLVWLLQQDMLPVPPPGWQPAPAASDRLTTYISYCLMSGQRQAAYTLWRFAQQLQLQLDGKQLAQAAFEGAVHTAAAKHDQAALQHLLDFALHYRTLARWSHIAVLLSKDASQAAAGQVADARDVAEPAITLLEQAVNAAAHAGQQGDSKVQCAALIVSAHAAPAGSPLTEVRHTRCPSRSCQEKSSSIMPLWQHAAVALTAHHMAFDLFHFKVEPDAAVMSVLEPVVLDQARMDVRRADCAAGPAPPATATAAAAAAAAAATPTFLKGAAVGASSLLTRPAPPPEHNALAAVLRAMQPPGSSSALWGWTRPDAVAWLLHSDQQHLFETPTELAAAAAMIAKLVDLAGYPLHQKLAAAALQEQQLRCHRGLLSHTQGVTEGFGALPRLAAGAADIATVLLRLGCPVDASTLVKRLNGATGAAAIECAKAMVAAVLAFPLEQLHDKGVKFAIPTMPRDRKEAFESGRWLCVSPAAVRKAVDVGDMDLITLLILWNQCMYDIFEGVF
jgi:hypothetical protein